MRRRSSNYPAELRERAERMVAAVRPDYPSDWPAICAVAGARIGVLGRRGRGLIALRRAAEPSTTGLDHDEGLQAEPAPEVVPACFGLVPAAPA
jgi:hypothetical protein